MRIVYDSAPTLGVTPIEEIFVDPQSRDDVPRIALALQSIWMNHRLRDQILTDLQQAIGGPIDQQVGRPGMNYWRVFVLAVFKFGLDCDFDRLTHMANRDGLVRALLQTDDSGFGPESSYRCQTVIHNVNRITEPMWAHLNRMIVDHGLAVIEVAPDAPIEARCDSYVVETHVKHPHDVRLLRDSVLNALNLACKAWEAHDLGAHGGPGWRQRPHLMSTLKNGYLAIQTCKKRAKHPELVLDFFALCSARIRKCVRILNALQSMDPTSVWIPRLEKAISQFHAQVSLVHRRVMENEQIPTAEKLLSLPAAHTRWIRKGKSRPNEVELGVPVAVIEHQERLILG